MKEKKIVSKILLITILAMMFSFITIVFATEEGVTEITIEDIDGEEVEETEAEEPTTAKVKVNLGDKKVVLIVDAEGNITSVIIDGEEVVDSELIGTTLNEGIETLVDSTEECPVEEPVTEGTEEPAVEGEDDDAVEDEEDEFIISIEIESDNEEFEASLISSLEDSDFSCNFIIEDSENQNQERFDNALALGITAGKMNLLEKLNLEEGLIEWAEKSVKEIMAEIKAKRNAVEVVEEELEVTTGELLVETTDVEVKSKKPAKTEKTNKGKKK